MDLKKINDKLQAYDKNLEAVVVEGQIQSPSGFTYTDKGIRVRAKHKNGSIYDVADFFKNESDPDFIVKSIMKMDSFKGHTETFKGIQKKNKDWEEKKDKDLREEMETINKDVADYASRLPVSFNFNSK